MKGVILAGGTGSRLGRLTTVINKHLVAVGDVPMIEYPLATLKRLRIKDITVVSGAEHVGSVLHYLTETHPEIDFTYKVQKKAGGIAQALALTENVIGSEKFTVILGDNIFEENFSEKAAEFERSNATSMLFLKRVQDASRFGVAEIRDNRVISLVEKPQDSKSNYAVTGLYFYDPTIFDKIRLLRPSARGEYEITEANNLLVQDRGAICHVLDSFWSDAGTPESRRRVEEYIYSVGNSRFLK